MSHLVSSLTHFVFADRHFLLSGCLCSLSLCTGVSKKAHLQVSRAHFLDSMTHFVRACSHFSFAMTHSSKSMTHFRGSTAPSSEAGARGVDAGVRSPRRRALLLDSLAHLNEKSPLSRVVSFVHVSILAGSRRRVARSTVVKVRGRKTSPIRSAEKAHRSRGNPSGSIAPHPFWVTRGASERPLRMRKVRDPLHQG
jgi:hypothetical protein